MFAAAVESKTIDEFSNKAPAALTTAKADFKFTFIVSWKSSSE